MANKFPHALELATGHLATGHPHSATGHPHVAHGRHGVRLRAPQSSRPSDALPRLPYLFFLHFVSRSGIPLTSFPNLELFSTASATAYEFRVWATRCLNWATVIAVPADSRLCLLVTRPCVYHTGAGSSRRRPDIICASIAHKAK